MPSTGRISRQPAASPPSNRISTRPIVPSVRVELGVVELDAADAVGAGEHAQAEEQQEAGTRTRSATFAAARPAAIRRPATRISWPSDMRGYAASSAAASRASISSGESGPIPSPGRSR